MDINTEITTDNNGKAIISFYDAEYANAKTFGKLGQFVSSYYVSTLIEDQKSLKRCGLDLCGYERKWKLTGDQMKKVFETLTTKGGHHENTSAYI